ncbi:MAG: hypothetical protein OHK0017_01260 [Patescibacteria group bacterium]
MTSNTPDMNPQNSYSNQFPSQFQNQTTSAPRPAAQSNSVNSQIPKHKKRNGFLTQLRLVFSTVLILLLFVGAAAVYVMLRPNGRAAQLASKYLNFNYQITSKESAPTVENGSNTAQENNAEGGGNKFLDTLFGLNKPITNGSISRVADPATLEQMSYEKVVETVLPSVLSISVVTSRGTFQTANVSGTGFFVSDDGLVVTNKHVISTICTNPNNSQNQILGTDYQNKAYELQVVSLDPTSDLALLKVKDAGDAKFTKVSFYPTDKLKLGMPVMAIGNALGQLKNTVTAGIISGLNRQVTDTDEDSACGGFVSFDTGLIQTDAAINSGNSGGPLFSREGLLIGVNTFNSPTAQSIGLSIPADDVVKNLDSYLKNGKIVKPYLGVKTQNINETLKRQNSWLPINYGAIIVLTQDAVASGSAADKAGLKAGDIIMRINDQDVRETENVSAPLRRLLNQYEPGQKVTLQILRPVPAAAEAPNGTTQIQYEPVPRNIEVTLGSLESELKF